MFGREVQSVIRWGVRKIERIPVVDLFAYAIFYPLRSKIATRKTIQFAESVRLEAIIKENLRRLGYD